MPDIPEEAVQAAALAVDKAFVAEFGYGWNAAFEETVARAVLEAAVPFLSGPVRRPRVVCPVCGRDLVARADGKPIVHFPPSGRTDLTCDGRMSSHCQGGCKCRRHRG